MVNDLNANGSASPYESRFRFDDGSRLTTTAKNQITTGNFGTMRVPLANGAVTETDGLDLAAQYRRATENCGTFTVYAAATLLFNYEYDDPSIHVNASDPMHPIYGPYTYDGQYTDANNGIGGAQGTLPDYQLNLGLTWEYKDWTYNINARYIPGVDDLGFLHPSVIDNSLDEDGNPNAAHGFTNDGKARSVDSWFSIDMQLAYEIGKTAGRNHWYDGFRFALGCNNITDETPSFISSSFEDNTDKSTYDIRGRFVYFEVSKKF